MKEPKRAKTNPKNHTVSEIKGSNILTQTKISIQPSSDRLKGSVESVAPYIAAGRPVA